MKKIYAFIGAFLIVTTYQNCSPARFSSTMENGGLNNVNGGVEPLLTKVIELTPQESLTYPSTQLVLVVDNSGTMQQSQESLAAKINSLLDTLSGRLVTVRVLTTSDYLGRPAASDSYTYKVGDQLFENKTNAVPENATDVKTVVYYGNSSYIAGSRYLPNYRSYGAEQGPYGESFVIDPRESVTKQQEAIDKLKQKIAAIKTEGSDYESGLCSIAQFLNSKLPFNASEKTVFFILTDEDNLKSKHCKSHETTSFIQKAAYKVKNVRIYTKVERVKSPIKDGIVQASTSSTDTDLLSGSSLPESINLIGKACVGRDLDYARTTSERTGNVYPTLRIESAKMISCTYILIDEMLYATEATPNFCTEAYQDAPNIMEWYTQNNKGVYSTNSADCKKSLSWNPSQTVTNYILENKSTVAESFIDTIKNSPVANNYQISVVGHFSGESCALKSQQSYGSVFSSLAQLDPSHVKTYSICEEDQSYREAFAEIAKAVTEIQEEFALPLEGGMEVREVYLSIDGGPYQRLAASDYAVVSNKLTLPKHALKLTDKIKVVLF